MGRVLVTGALIAAAVLVVGLALSALLAAYIPFTHMIHFVAKYFTYHTIRWDDRPNRPGGSVERKMAASSTPAYTVFGSVSDGSRCQTRLNTQGFCVPS